MFKNIIRKTDVIKKIIDTFHTAGIFSFSMNMYGLFTQPFDGISQNKMRQDSRSFIYCNINLLKNINQAFAGLFGTILYQ